MCVAERARASLSLFGFTARSVCIHCVVRGARGDGPRTRSGRVPVSSFGAHYRVGFPSQVVTEFLILVDIPSGYRLHEFQVLSDVLRERNIRLRVIFMSRAQKGRLWRYQPDHFSFYHSFARGLSFFPAEHLPVYVNPCAWVDILRAAPRWLWLGSSWYQPAVMASAVFSRAGTTLIGVESWQTREARVGRLRRGVMGRCDGFIVPGQRAEEHAHSLAPGPTLRFPNFVDETSFGEQTARMKADRQAIRRSFGFGDETVFAWPARLDTVKGIIPFLEAVRDVRGDYAIAIAGEGPQRAAIERLVTAMPQVRLLGHLWPQDLVRLYAAADVLLLPSLFEPYGFVAVEGLWAGLPLLLSDRVGALPEVLVEGENGWVVDAADAEHVRKTFAEVVETGSPTLASMGERSHALAEERFTSRTCAEAFVADLLKVFPA